MDMTKLVTAKEGTMMIRQLHTCPSRAGWFFFGFVAAVVFDVALYFIFGAP